MRKHIQSKDNKIINNLKALSIQPNEELSHLKTKVQKAITTSTHQNDEKYLILSTTKLSKEQGIGLFNTSTDFMVTKNNSLLYYNTKDKNTKTLNIEKDIISNEDNHLLYIYPYKYSKIIGTKNESLTIEMNTPKLKKVIYLNYELGYKIGKYLKTDINQFTKTEALFVKAFILGETKKRLNTKLILNSNEIFLLGIIDALFQDNNIMKDLNVYSISLILNYLGAWYSVNNLEEYKQFRIKLPKELYYTSSLSINYFKKHEKFIKDQDGDDYLLIPLNSLEFKRVQDKIKINKDIYDLTMEDHTSTNHATMFTPFMKNSDGDILLCAGVWSKQGLEDAYSFSPENKDYYRSLSDGNIQNFIQHDSVLGLYNCTNHLK